MTEEQQKAIALPHTPHDMHGRWPQAETVDDFRYNLSAVNRRIAMACERSGREFESVRLLPISKTKGESAIRLAYTAGLRVFGENKVQEAQQKYEATQDIDDIRWSIVGHLQTNKAKLVARFADEFQALDSLRVAMELERHLQREARQLDVFVQVNTSGEASKYGLQPQDVPAFIASLASFPTLRIRGLMTLAIFSDDTKRVRECFVRLRNLRDRLLQEVADPTILEHLSMGMSGDFEVAIEEGATVVRVGQAIFGARSTPDGHYWPTASELP